MKIRGVKHNNRRKTFEVRLYNRTLFFPYVRAEPGPSAKDRLVEVRVDREIANEGFTYTLESGKQGTVHVDQVLAYNEDPGYLKDVLLYKLTIEAQTRIDESSLSKREIIRRLGTSATQFYRLLDQTNYRKSMGQLLSLLSILDCEVDLVVQSRSA